MCRLHGLIALNAHLSAIYSAPRAFIGPRHSVAVAVAVTKRWLRGPQLNVNVCRLLYAALYAQLNGLEDILCFIVNAPPSRWPWVNGRLRLRRRRHLVISVINVSCHCAHLPAPVLMTYIGCPWPAWLIELRFLRPTGHKIGYFWKTFFPANLLEWYQRN